LRASKIRGKASDDDSLRLLLHVCALEDLDNAVPGYGDMS